MIWGKEPLISPWILLLYLFSTVVSNHVSWQAEGLQTLSTTKPHLFFHGGQVNSLISTHTHHFHTLTLSPAWHWFETIYHEPCSPCTPSILTQCIICVHLLFDLVLFALCQEGLSICGQDLLMAFTFLILCFMGFHSNSDSLRLWHSLSLLVTILQNNDLISLLNRAMSVGSTLGRLECALFNMFSQCLHTAHSACTTVMSVFVWEAVVHGVRCMLDSIDLLLSWQ